MQTTASYLLGRPLSNPWGELKANAFEASIAHSACLVSFRSRVWTMQHCPQTALSIPGVG